jgi:hypothetical protein
MAQAFKANGPFPSGVSVFDVGGGRDDGLFTLNCPAAT